jgi:hypothetical protein
LVGRAVTATAVIVAVAGCGGDDGVSKADFIRRADAICREGNAKVRALQDDIAAAQRSSDQRRVYAELARLTARSAQLSSPYVARLDALDTPAGDRDELKAWVAGARRQLDAVRRMSTAFRAGDDARIATLAEQVDALASRTNAFARRYGMTDCANSA